MKKAILMFLINLLLILSCTTGAIKPNSMENGDGEVLMLRRKTGLIKVKDKIDKINIGITTKNEILDLFGDPLEINNNLYMFAGGLKILFSTDRVEEIRLESPGGTDFFFQNELMIGSSLDQVLDVIGKPRETVTGKNDWQDNILYVDINGDEGACYYSVPEMGVRFYFQDYKILAIHLTAIYEADVITSEYISLEGVSIAPSPSSILLDIIQDRYSIITNSDYTCKIIISKYRTDNPLNIIKGMEDNYKLKASDQPHITDFYEVNCLRSSYSIENLENKALKLNFVVLKSQSGFMLMRIIKENDVDEKSIIKSINSKNNYDFYDVFNEKINPIKINEDFPLSPYYPKATLKDCGDPEALTSHIRSLNKINYIRIKAGLKPVKLNNKIYQCAYNHLNYLRLHGTADGYHYENPEKEGYTGENAYIRSKKTGVKVRDFFMEGVVGTSWGGVDSAIDWLLTAPGHRFAIISPDTQEIGIAHTKDYDWYDGSMESFFVINLTRLRDRTTKPYIYPYDGQENVPLAFNGGEVPDPIPRSTYPDREYPVGYPITILFSGDCYLPIEFISAKVKDESGKNLPLYVAHKGNNKSIAWLSDIFIMLKAILKENTIYYVEVVYLDKEEEKVLKWQFKTGEGRR